jgi:Pyruvate/2-oxoacid:ferredoxin oxidoreductase delta subunit
VLDGCYFFKLVTEGIMCSARLECFILCPDGSIQYLEDSFLGFEGQKWHVKNFTGI